MGNSKRKDSGWVSAVDLETFSRGENVYGRGIGRRFAELTENLPFDVGGKCLKNITAGAIWKPEIFSQEGWDSFSENLFLWWTVSDEEDCLTAGD